MFLQLYSSSKNKGVFVNTDYIAFFECIGVYGTKIVFCDGSVDTFRVDCLDISRRLNIELPRFLEYANDVTPKGFEGGN